MKVNKKYIHTAVLHTAIEKGSVEEIANRTAEQLGGAIEVYKTKTDGFILRQKKSAEVSKDELTEAITAAICSILEDDIEDATDYIAENYDFPYDPDKIEENHIRDLLDYTYDGRLIYVELDM
ncbi:MAG: hypothetical protein K2F99_02730 [Muribaculaceae bacterium]|nr:hypothetical protein [Muribaculaceae bacterium]